MEADPYCTLFLFINDSSGGGVGSKLLMQEVNYQIIQIEKVEFNISIHPEGDPKLIFVYLYNMVTSREKAFFKLR